MNQHLSEDEISQWISGERLAETERHLLGCSRCAAEVDATEKAFALFRESSQRWSDHWYRPTPVPAQRAGLRAGSLLADARGSGLPVRSRDREGAVYGNTTASHGWRPGAMAACAAMCAVCAALLYPVPAPSPAAAAGETRFLAMPYVAPLAPYERIEVVRMHVSVAELTAAGLEVRVPDTGATVLADVVLGQDGRAHAIRLVNGSWSTTQ